MNKKSLSDTLLLKPKIALRKTEINIEETEKAVQNIHQPEVHAPEVSVIVPKNAEPVSAAAEITKRVTLDIPLKLHAAIKMRTFQDGITIKEYLLTLAAADLNG